MMVHMFADDLVPVKADVSNAAAATAATAPAVAAEEGMHSLAFLEIAGHMPEPLLPMVKEEQQGSVGRSAGERGGERDEDVVGEEDFVQAFWFTRVRGSEEQHEGTAADDTHAGLSGSYHASHGAADVADFLSLTAATAGAAAAAAAGAAAEVQCSEHEGHEGFGHMLW